MLKVNPEERLSITELVNLLQEIAAARNVNPKSPITEVGMISSALIGKYDATINLIVLFIIRIDGMLILFLTIIICCCKLSHLRPIICEGPIDMLPTLLHLVCVCVGA